MSDTIASDNNSDKPMLPSVSALIDQTPFSDDPRQVNEGILDEKLSQAGELYEDVHDIFRMAQRASTMMIKHSLKISHTDAARIMEAWWMGCRKKY